MTIEMSTNLEMDELQARLWPHGDRPEDDQVHAIVDGARDPRIFDLLLRTGLEYTCLFAGRLSPSLRAAAPYLVHLAPGVNFTRRFFSEGWGNSWGVLTVAPADVTLPRLRRHLRTLLRVQDEAGRKLLFRFYDPRVLRVYLPTCTGDETRRVFGPIDAFVIESGGPGSSANWHYPHRRPVRESMEPTEDGADDVGKDAAKDEAEAGANQL
jgi:hypothetical protein